MRFNAACLSIELGESKAATEHLLVALKNGSPPEHARKERLLRVLLDDPRVHAALARPTKARKKTGFVTHRRPELR